MEVFTGVGTKDGANDGEGLDGFDVDGVSDAASEGLNVGGCDTGRIKISLSCWVGSIDRDTVGLNVSRVGDSVTT
jgi:hypothetical protein